MTWTPIVMWEGLWQGIRSIVWASWSAAAGSISTRVPKALSLWTTCLQFG
jgi:hypothetical protein